MAGRFGLPENATERASPVFIIDPATGEVPGAAANEMVARFVWGDSREDDLLAYRQRVLG